MNNNQNNPQEAPQVKSVEEILEDHCLKPIKMVDYNGALDAMKELQSRIAELEKQNSELEALQKSDEKHIKSLEKQIKQYEGIVDKHIISSANYTAEYVDNVIAERDKYMEALEELCQLKHYKDQVGKDGLYLERQPKAWEAANKLLNELKRNSL